MKIIVGKSFLYVSRMAKNVLEGRFLIAPIFGGSCFWIMFGFYPFFNNVQWADGIIM